MKELSIEEMETLNGGVEPACVVFGAVTGAIAGMACGIMCAIGWDIAFGLGAQC